jgi:hypothetical protein
MAEPVHTILGRFSKFEIYRGHKFFGSYFTIHKDGKYWKGEFSSLQAAARYVEEAMR